ncbi:unnamed protein product [Debaryomyces tyrocola]|nr:unnamed protein product [Debaryomyces tyrocola]
MLCSSKTVRPQRSVFRTLRVPISLFHSSCFMLAGHSKWANIKHDKAKNDAKKSREAYSIATRIVSSVKAGGVDGNAQLLTLVEKAKKLNVTKKIIENAIKRGTGEISSEGQQLSEVTYEFMGPGGVAFIVEASTDNKTRTIGLVKHAMSKFNASLSPCQYLFDRKGSIIFSPLNETETLDDVLEVAIDIGAEDVEDYKDTDNEYGKEKLFKIVTDVGDIFEISNKLSAKGYALKDSTTGYMAESDTLVEFPEAHEKGLKKALELLDEIPELTNYYSNIKDDE